MRVELDRYQARQLVDSCWSTDNDLCRAIVHALEEYENVRSDPRRFIVAPAEEHFFPEIENTLERNEWYWVVEKYGVAGDLAAKVDPRRVGLRGQQRAPALA